MKSKIAIKSIVLGILIILSIVQIEKLWFEKNSNHGFFPYIPQKQVANRDLEDLMIEPAYIAIYQGKTKGEYYLLDAAGIFFNGILKDASKLIRHLPRMTAIDYQYQDLYSRPHILCQLSLPIESQVLAKIAKQGRVDPGQVKTMVILPAGLEETYFRLLFFDQNNHLLMGLASAKADLADENEVFGQYISNQEILGDSLLLSAKGQALPGFGREILLPSPQANYILPLEWVQEFAFIDHPGGKVDIKGLEEFFYAYVKNPKILWNIVEDHRIRYGDSSILMEYTTEGMFSYQYIQALDQKGPSLAAGPALEKALAFFNQDSLLAGQEFKLAKYVHQDKRHYFYFDYYFRGYPFIWDQAYQKTYQMQYPMQVVVEQDQVVEYRRLLLQDDYLLQQGSRFQVNYEEALNRFYQDHDRDMLANLYLGYYHQDNNIQLGWVVETEGDQFLYQLDLGAKNYELE